MNCRRGPDRRQRGSALVIALLVFAVASALMVAMTGEFALFVARGQNTFVARQADAYLRGGEELAGLALRQDIERDGEERRPRDDPAELWARQAPPYALDEGGWLVGRLEDLQGRFNLNSVSGEPPEGRRFSAAQEQFIRLLQTPEEPRVSRREAVLIAEALMDWLDPDGEPRDFGAEDDYYFDSTPSYRSGNGTLHSVSELRLVARVTAEIYAAVAPYLTVYGEGEVINIHTAPIPVLRTINAAGELSPLSPEEGEALDALRGEEGFESVRALLDSAVLADREISPELRARLGETSEWFLYAGEVEVADRTARLYSVLRREGGRVRAVVRSGARLPEGI